MSFDATLPFTLPALPPTSVDLQAPALQRLVAKARSELGELKGLSLGIPNALLLISPAVLKESVSSSEIENIHTTLVEVLQGDLFPEIERRPPDKEVLRYRDAILWGAKEKSTVALSSRLICGIHKKLLEKASGEYRKTQNKIQNTATSEIIYTPPIASQIPETISAWETFVNSDTEFQEIDPLIKVALAHYQFEAIHPFEDGNGRTGRILMVLQLMEYGFLNMPVLYISGYINKNRTQYYQKLLSVSTSSAWLPFLTFMLEGFATQAANTKTLILKIMELNLRIREEIKEKCPKIKNPIELSEHLFASPVTSPVHVEKKLGIHYTTGTRYLNQLVEIGILKESWIGKNHFYFNKKLINILNDKKLG